MDQEGAREALVITDGKLEKLKTAVGIIVGSRGLQGDVGIVQ
jgi:hypothetical protein